MQLRGNPFAPHRTRPLTTAGSGLFKFEETATSSFPLGPETPRTRNPYFGSRKTPAAVDGLYAEASQLYAEPFALYQDPNSPNRMPRFSVNRGVTRQSSWKYGSATLYRL